jgi:hypothetical protein
MGKSVLETFTIFPFSIVLALALGEAFKQFVSEKHEGAIQWDRTLALLTFLLLILPFYQGMNRYLLQTYGGTPTPQFSPLFLIFDGVAFMAESAIFFAMSRNLSDSRAVCFYWMVFVLLLVDSFSGFSAVQHARECAKVAIYSWIVLNVVTCAGLLLILAFAKRFSSMAAVAAVGTAAMLARTVTDYMISWDFYFSSCT